MGDSFLVVQRMILTAYNSNGQGDIENQAVSNTARTSKQLNFLEPTTQRIVCTLVIHTQCLIGSFGDEKAEPTKKQHKAKRTTLPVAARPAFIASLTGGAALCRLGCARSWRDGCYRTRHGESLPLGVSEPVTWLRWRVQNVEEWGR